MAPSGSGDGARILANDQLEEARAKLQARCDADQQDIDAWLQLADISGQVGSYQIAERCARHVLALHPNHLAATYLLALSLGHQDKNAEAIECYQKVLAVHPDFTEASINLADLFLRDRQPEHAELVCERALTLQPDHPQLLARLGSTLLCIGRPQEALALLECASSRQPEDPLILGDLGVAYHRLGRYDDALEVITRALSHDNNLAREHYNLGVVHSDLGNTAAAIRSYEAALLIDPTNNDAMCNLSHAELAQGKFAQGWAHHIGRPSRVLPAPASSLRPGDLDGSRVLLMREQGLGDELFFLRFAPQIRRRAAHLACIASKKIAGILDRTGVVDQVVPATESLDDYDHVYSVADAPLLVGMSSMQQIPPPVPLPLLESRVSAVDTMLASVGPPPYIGVTWRAGTQPDTMAGSALPLRRALDKRIPPELLGMLLNAFRGTVLILQRNPDRKEIDAFESALERKAHELSHLNEALEDMLILLDRVNEYVCVSNTNVHLRVGRGKPARVLLPYPPDWRWLRIAEEAVWFPGCQTYPQKEDGNWTNSLSRLASDLNLSGCR